MKCSKTFAQAIKEDSQELRGESTKKACSCEMLGLGTPVIGIMEKKMETTLV